jgi:hypothetical protein
MVRTFQRWLDRERVNEVSASPGVRDVLSKLAVCLVLRSGSSSRRRQYLRTSIDHFRL